MFKSERVRILLKVLFVIICIIAIAIITYGIFLISARNAVLKQLGVRVIVIGIVFPLSSFLGCYALYALSKIESNTAEANKKLDKLINDQKISPDETRGSNLGFSIKDKKEEERPEPLHDEFGRF